MNRRIIACTLLLPLAAAAQEPLFMEAATQPAVGLNYLRTQLLVRNLDHGTDWNLKLRYTRGIRYNVSLNAETTYADGDGADHLRLFAKWRVLQNDLGPIDTLRGSLIGGAEFSDESADPLFGGVITTILGRHGINADLIWQAAKGGNDRLSCDASWLYRISPVRWQANTKASWYTVVELNSHHWESGESELLIAPGLLYEARSWAAEIALRLPLSENMDPGSAENVGFAVGLRHLW